MCMIIALYLQSATYILRDMYIASYKFLWAVMQLQSIIKLFITVTIKVCSYMAMYISIMSYGVFHFW